MKFAAGFALGLWTGLAIWQGPKWIAPLFADSPETPYDHKDKHYYFSGGVRQ